MSGFILGKGALSKAMRVWGMACKPAAFQNESHDAPFPVPWSLAEARKIGKEQQARSDAAVERARKRLEARAMAEGFWSLRAAWRAGDER